MRKFVRVQPTYTVEAFQYGVEEAPYPVWWQSRAASKDVLRLDNAGDNKFPALVFLNDCGAWLIWPEDWIILDEHGRVVILNDADFKRLFASV